MANLLFLWLSSSISLPSSLSKNSWILLHSLRNRDSDFLFQILFSLLSILSFPLNFRWKNSPFLFWDLYLICCLDTILFCTSSLQNITPLLIYTLYPLKGSSISFSRLIQIVLHTNILKTFCQRNLLLIPIPPSK